MKTRNGFVSNSSSSSFIVITTKQSHISALASLTDNEREVIKGMPINEGTVAGVEIIAVGSFDTPGGSMFEWMDLPDDFDCNTAWDVWQKYQKIVKENSMSHSMDW